MDKKKVWANAIAGAVTMGLALASSSILGETSKKIEKCYGLAKSGQNDAKDKTVDSVCKGLSKRDEHQSRWSLKGRRSPSKVASDDQVSSYKGK